MSFRLFFASLFVGPSHVLSSPANLDPVDNPVVVDFRDGITFQKQCLSLPEPITLPEICLAFELRTCDQLKANVQLTYGGDEIFATEINSVDDLPQYCWDAGQLCKTCLKIESVDFSPSHGSICPILELTCTIETPFGPINSKVPTKLNCLDFGQKCEALDCSSCMETKGCGWCSSKDVGCQAVLDLPDDVVGGEIGKSKPFCSECDESRFFWITEQTIKNGRTCADPSGMIAAKTKEREKSMKKVSVGLIIGIVFGVLVILLCCFILCKRRHKLGQTLRPAVADRGQYAEPVQLEDEEYTGPPMTAGYDTVVHEGREKGDTAI